MEDTTMRIVHLHTGSDGESHFADLEVEITEDAGGTKFELLTAVQGFAVRDLVASWSNDFHNAPRRQLVLQLNGRGEIVCGDGTSRVLGPGDLLLADDITGKGHISREVEGPRRLALIYLDPRADLGTITAR
jgi:hypothetical protein